MPQICESCANSMVSTGAGESMFQCNSDPSEPPDTRTSECIGCHWTEQTSRAWPRRSCSSRICRMSKILMDESREAEATMLPFGDQLSAWTVFLWSCLDTCDGSVKPILRSGSRPYSVRKSVPVLGSQNLIKLFLLPDTSRLLVGCHFTHLTSYPCPVMDFSSSLLSKSQIFTLPSSLPVTKRISSGANEMSLMGSVWPLNRVTLFMFGWKYLMIPPLSHDTSHAPL